MYLDAEYGLSGLGGFKKFKRKLKKVVRAPLKLAKKIAPVAAAHYAPQTIPMIVQSKRNEAEMRHNIALMQQQADALALEKRLMEQQYGGAMNNYVEPKGQPDLSGSVAKNFVLPLAAAVVAAVITKG